MKSMEEYINNVFEKYAEAESNHEIYKSIRIRPYKIKAKKCSLIICFLLTICVCISYNFIRVDNDNPIISKNDSTITFTQYLSANTLKRKEAILEMINNSDLISIVNSYNIKGNNVNIIRNKIVKLQTISEFNVCERFIDREKNKDNIIKYLNCGGIISLADLEKNEGIDWSKWEKDNLNFQVNKYNKRNIFLKQVINETVEIEAGKNYLAFLKYNENGYYEPVNIVYGIMEYDPETNLVKNVDTGEFEEFDWSLLEEKNS